MKIWPPPIDWGGTNITWIRMTPHEMWRLGKTIGIRARGARQKLRPREMDWGLSRGYLNNGGNPNADRSPNAKRRRRDGPS